MRFQTKDKSSASSTASFLSSALTPPSPPSRSSTVQTTHSYDCYLIPDTFELPNPSASNLTKHPSRASSWETYLFEDAQYKEDMEEDKSALRHDIMASLKHYYGKRAWENIDVIEDVELRCDDERYKPYMDQVIVYGESGSWRKACKYFDRSGREVEKSEFRRERLPQCAERPGLARRIRNRLTQERKAFSS